MKTYNRQKILSFLYLFFLVLCLILYPFVTGAARGRETVSARQMPGYQILVPVSCNTLEDSSAPAGIRKEYTLYPVQMQEGENYLLFYQVHHYVEIYQNENLIYRLTPDQCSRSKFVSIFLIIFVKFFLEIFYG